MLARIASQCAGTRAPVAHRTTRIDALGLMVYLVVDLMGGGSPASLTRFERFIGVPIDVGPVRELDSRSAIV